MEQGLERRIEIIKNEYNAIAPKAAERLQKLPFLRLVNLPPTVRICLSEATETFGFGKFLASIIVCRVCLEAALVVAHGRNEQNLKVLIDECEKEGILSSAIARKAQEIRMLGNNYVHMLTDKIADELTRAGKVTRFKRAQENVILVQIGQESDALKANALMRDIVGFLYGARP